MGGINPACQAETVMTAGMLFLHQKPLQEFTSQGAVFSHWPAFSKQEHGNLRGPWGLEILVTGGRRRIRAGMLGLVCILIGYFMIYTTAYIIIVPDDADIVCGAKNLF